MFYSGISDEAGQAIETQIKAHQQLGWSYLEIRNVDGENLSLMSEEKFARVYEKVTAAGLKVSCFAGCIGNWAKQISGDFSIDVQELKTAIPRMHRFGTRYVRIMSWPNDKNNPWSDTDWSREVIRRLRELTKMAEDGGIILVHENCSGWGGESVENSLRLVEEINSPAFKLLYDTGNVVPHGQDPWEFYTRTKPYTVYIHIKDYRRDGEKYVATFPGEGEGMIKEILQDLLHTGYPGGISIEPHLASVVHEGKVGKENVAYETYLTYGRKLMALVESLKK